MNIAEATSSPRIHHQWKPDRLRMEEGFAPNVLEELREMGHEIEMLNSIGVTQSVMRVGDTLYGAADPRSGSSLAAGY